jgi:hypothetical protein
MRYFGSVSEQRRFRGFSWVAFGLGVVLVGWLLLHVALDLAAASFVPGRAMTPPWRSHDASRSMVPTPEPVPDMPTAY